MSLPLSPVTFFFLSPVSTQRSQKRSKEKMLNKLKDTPVENLRPIKVRVIGAGYSGIYLGIKIPQRIRNVDLRIYEKNEGVGGTWWENRYPGNLFLL